MKWIFIIERKEAPQSADTICAAARALPGNPVIVNYVTATSKDYPPVNPAAIEAVIEMTTEDEGATQAEYDVLTAILEERGVLVSGALAVDEVVQVNRTQRNWSNGETAGDAKDIYFPRRKDGTTRQDFLSHWRNNHAPLARKHHRGMSRYIQHFAHAFFGNADRTIEGFATVHCPDRDGWTLAVLPDAEAVEAIFTDLEKFTGRSDAYQVNEIVVKSAPQYESIG